MNVLMYIILFVVTLENIAHSGGNSGSNVTQNVEIQQSSLIINSNSQVIDDTETQDLIGQNVTTGGATSITSNQNVVNEKLRTAENNPVANSLCRAFVLIKGYIIPIIVLLWIITGIGFFIGKISWGIVIALMVGTTLTVASSKMAASYILNDASGDIKDACECRFGVNCDSPYE